MPTFVKTFISLTLLTYVSFCHPLMKIKIHVFPCIKMCNMYCLCLLDMTKDVYARTKPEYVVELSVLNLSVMEDDEDTTLDADVPQIFARRVYEVDKPS